MIGARRVKTLLGAMLLRTGLYRRLLRGRALVLVFHRIGDAYPNDALGMPEHRFARFCDVLPRYFRVTTLADIVQRLEARESVDGLLAITFDDGYRDNYDAAAKLLEERGLRGCFFLASGYVGTERIPGWDADHGVTSRWMSWDQVRELARRGFEIGAHTVNHVNLGDAESFARVGAPPLPPRWQVEADPATQEREIVESRARIEAELSAAVTLFAYPFGRRENLSEANREVVRRAGFAACCAAFGGTVGAGDDPHALNRIPVSRWYDSPEHLVFEVALGRA